MERKKASDIINRARILVGDDDPSNEADMEPSDVINRARILVGDDDPSNEGEGSRFRGNWGGSMRGRGAAFSRGGSNTGHGGVFGNSPRNSYSGSQNTFFSMPPPPPVTGPQPQTNSVDFFYARVTSDEPIDFARTAQSMFSQMTMHSTLPPSLMDSRSATVPPGNRHLQQASTVTRGNFNYANEDVDIIRRLEILDLEVATKKHEEAVKRGKKELEKEKAAEQKEKAAAEKERAAVEKENVLEKREKKLKEDQLMLERDALFHQCLREAVECIICFGAPCSIVFLDCGHRACSACADYLEQCHVCRQTIKRKMPFH